MHHARIIKPVDVRANYERLRTHFMPEGWAYVHERMAAGDHFTVPSHVARLWAGAKASEASMRGETPETLVAGKPHGRFALKAIEQGGL